MAKCLNCGLRESTVTEWTGTECRACEMCDCIWVPETGEILVEPTLPSDKVDSMTTVSWEDAISCPDRGSDEFEPYAWSDIRQYRCEDCGLVFDAEDEAAVK